MSADKEKIERAAYRIWEESGRPEGRELDHWLAAEAQVAAAKPARAPAKAKPAKPAKAKAEAPKKAAAKSDGAAKTKAAKAKAPALA